MCCCSRICSWLICICAMTHSHMCRDSFPCVPWLIHMCAVTHSHVCRDSFPCVPWLVVGSIHGFQGAALYVAAQEYALWFMRMCAVSHPSVFVTHSHCFRWYEWASRGSAIYCCSRIWAMTPSSVCCASFICVLLHCLGGVDGLHGVSLYVAAPE